MSNAAKDILKSYSKELKDNYRLTKEILYLAAQEAYDLGWDDCINALADLEEEEELLDEDPYFEKE